MQALNHVFLIYLKKAKEVDASLTYLQRIILDDEISLKKTHIQSGYFVSFSIASSHISLQKCATSEQNPFNSG